MRLVRRLREESPQLVHGFTIKGVVYGSIAPRLAGIPLRVATITGLGYVFVSRDLTARLLRPGVRILLRLALGGEGSRVIFQNPDDAGMFRRRRVVEPSKIRLVRGAGEDFTSYMHASAVG